MSVTREQLILEARTWLGTPFHHQGRIKGVGVDCVGLVAETMRACGLPVTDRVGYSHQPDGLQLLTAMMDHAVPILTEEMQPGDVLLFRFNVEPQHVAFMTDIGMIHSTAANRRCVEHCLDQVWMSRLVAVFRLKGVE